MRALRAGHSKPQILIALVAIVALEAVFAAMARLGDLSIHIPEFMALALGGGVLYFIALYALEHTRDNRAVLWLVLLGALAFRLTLFPQPPSLSTDLHRYRWDGHVQNEGWNPYAVAPTDPRLAPLRDPGWYVMPVPEIPTMYPPLAQLVFRATWRVLPDPVGFKLPFLLADLAVAAMLAGWIRSTGGRNYQVAIYAWNPLVVVEFASSGHNDALAIAAVVATLLIIRRVPAMSTLTLTAGALAKAFPAVLLPLALFRAGWPGKLRGWLAAGGCAALAAVCVWPYRHGWREFLGMLKYYQLIFRNYHSSIYPVLLWLTGSHEIAAGVGEGVVHWFGGVAGGAPRGSHARGVSADRHGAALRAERVSVVFHVDRAAAVFLSEPGVAAADDSGISLVQNFHQLPRARRVALRSVLSVAVLCAILCAAGVGISAEEERGDAS